MNKLIFLKKCTPKIVLFMDNSKPNSKTRDFVMLIGMNRLILENQQFNDVG